MTPERFREIEDAFQRAHELTPVERSEFLDGLRTTDRELHFEVTSLLASEPEAANVLHRTIAAGAGQLVADGASAMIGKRLGPYKLVALIGEGGMGSVYRALRDDAEYRREVAVKVLRHGLGSAQAIARFRDERQILAALDHPGVVRLLDGGSTENGTPYLVLEYVQGVAITQFAREQSLSVVQRLELMLLVCEAVQYAHQQLVVHRDIKPSNILVGERGAPKLLDFGIAKLLDPVADDLRAAKTRTGTALLTPEYASPEQARGETSSTATDVYSLGAVLYELLAGRPPHQGTTNSLEALRMICEVEPDRPSAIAPAERRGVIAGDLDNIVLKALHKDPAHRYATVAQLAEDLRRHLGGQPVLARPATLGYRARKYVRRHRGKLAIAVAGMTALLVATVSSVREARRADREAALARQQFAQGRKLANTLVFDIEARISKLKGATAARELVLRSALDYLDGLAAKGTDDPALAREIALAYMRLGDVQGGGYDASLGNAKDALALYDKARAILDQMTSERDTPTTQHARATYLVGAGIAQQGNGDIKAAHDLLHEGLALSDSLPAGNRLDPALAIRAYHVSLYLDPVDEAPHDVDRGFDIANRWLAAEPASAEARYWMAVLHGDRSRIEARGSDPDGAVDELRQGVSILQVLAKAHPEDARFSRDLAVTESDLGGYLAGMGGSTIWIPGGSDLHGGEALTREELPLLEEIHLRDPDDVRGTVDLGGETASLAALIAERDPAASIPEFERALGLFESVPATGRGDFYTRQMEWFVHCAMTVPLMKLGRADDAKAQAGLGLALAGPLGIDSRDSAISEMCRFMVARSRHIAGDDSGAAELLEANVQALTGRLAQPARAVSDLIGLVETLGLLATVQPARACELHTRAAEAWRTWHPRTRFVEDRQAVLDAQARCDNH